MCQMLLQCYGGTGLKTSSTATAGSAAAIAAQRALLGEAPAPHLSANLTSSSANSAPGSTSAAMAPLAPLARAEAMVEPTAFYATAPQGVRSGGPDGSAPLPARPVGAGAASGGALQPMQDPL